MEVVLIAALLFILPTAAAFGISPGKKVFDFTPGGSVEGEVTLFNTESRPLSLLVQAEGELASSVTLDNSNVVLQPGESKIIHYTLHFPERLERPGTYTVFLIAKERSLEKQDGSPNEVKVSAVTAVASVIEVRVPYGGKIIDALFYIPPIDPYQPVLIKAQVTNVGDKPIKKIGFTAAITDREGTRVTTLRSDEKKLAPRERTDLLAIWDPQVAYGEYRAALTLFYDGNKQETATDIIIGTFLLESTSLAVKHFVFNQEAILVVDIKNNAHEQIIGTLEISITDKKSYSQNLEPTTLKLAPSEIQQVKQQWNIQGLAPAKYYGKLILGAKGRTSERKFIIILSEQGIETTFEQFNQLTGKSILLSPADAVSSGSSLTPVLLLSLVALFLLVLFVYLLKKRKPPSF
ncbi:hypothetical protein HYS50_02910 [Candidatus Woesearchaeota archaeon]|nr:hypothetical protein [Candidatus Woesearchaeota archaeon]